MDGYANESRANHTYVAASNSQSGEKRKGKEKKKKIVKARAAFPVEPLEKISCSIVDTRYEYLVCRIHSENSFSAKFCPIRPVLAKIGI